MLSLVVLRRGRLSLSRGGLLGEQNRVDVGEHTTRRDGDFPEQLVQLLVVAHSQLDVAGDDAGLLVVTGGVASQLEHLSSEVLEDSGQVHRGAGAHARRVLSPLEVAADTRHRELEPSLVGPGNRAENGSNGRGIAESDALASTSKRQD